MPLTVLSDRDIQQILHSLSHDEVIKLQDNLGEALHEYSTGDTNAGCCANFQPERTVMKKRGVTSLFMPSSTSTALGVKVVSLETPAETQSSHQSSLQSSQHGGEGSIDSTISSMDNMSVSQASTRSSQTSPSIPQTKLSTSLADLQGPPTPTRLEATPQTTTSTTTSTRSTVPKGILTLMDSHGNPLGILNAEELTAFRTSLAAISLLKRRSVVHTITVFGAGKQAYWHIRLALLLRAPDIHHINVINRSIERSLRMIRRFQPNHPDGNQAWAHVKFSVVAPNFVEYDRLLKDEVRKADVIFCCTPSTEPLFPHEYLTSHEGRRKGRFVTAIGSYAPHMVELHPEIIRHVVRGDHSKHGHGVGHLHHKTARSEGVIIVDTLDGCLKEAGEIIQAEVQPDQLVEIGELLMVKKSVFRDIQEGKRVGLDQGLLEWLKKGNVIYKSVGLGLMDLVVGQDLVRLAEARGIGTRIEDF